MRDQIKILVFLCLSVAPASMASEAHEMSLSLNTISLPIGGAEFQYEYALSPFMRLSVPLDVKVLSLTWLSNDLIYMSRLGGWGLMPELLVAPGLGLKFIYEGWYAEPSITLGYARMVYPDPYEVKEAAVFQPKLTLGYQTQIHEGLFVDLGIGLQGRFFAPRPDSITLVPLPVLKVALGYAF